MVFQSTPRAYTWRDAVILAILLTALTTAYVRADDDEFIIVRPAVCDGLSWSDWEYWYYGCYNW